MSCCFCIFQNMPTFTKYIANEDHYTEVISRIATVRETLWMGAHCKKCGRQEFCGDRIK